MKKFDDKEEFKHWNEIMSKKYDPDLFHTQSSFLINLLEKWRVNSVLKYIDANDQDEILEVGCGAGNVLEKIPKGKLYGVDLSGFLVEKARKKLKDRAKIEVGDAENLPFQDENFDKVYCTEVLEHVLHPEKVISEIHRVLKSDGVLVVTVPKEQAIDFAKKTLKLMGLYNLLLQNQGGYNTSELNEWHLHEFDFDKFKTAFQPFFILERVKFLPPRPFTFHYVCRFRKKE